MARDNRQCNFCKIEFDNDTEHAEHMANDHQRMVLEVVEIDSGKVVHQLTCTNTDQMIEKTMRGMLINMDTDKFLVREFGGV